MPRPSPRLVSCLLASLAAWLGIVLLASAVLALAYPFAQAATPWRAEPMILTIDSGNHLSTVYLRCGSYHRSYDPQSEGSVTFDDIPAGEPCSIDFEPAQRFIVSRRQRFNCQPFTLGLRCEVITEPRQDPHPYSSKDED